MDIVITGANGFLGSHLVKKFIDNGDNVYAIVKSHSEDISQICECKHIIFSEISDLDSSISRFKAIKNPIFFHLAWAGVNGQVKTNYSVQISNIKMACDAAIFAKKLNSSCFLSSGTIAENATLSFPNLEYISLGQMYSVSKKSTRLFLEVLCKNLSLPFVWMQFSNIYGPNNMTGNLISYTLSQLFKNQEATFGPCLQPYDFIFVDDLINAVFLLGKKNHHKYNNYFIGSGKPHLLKDYLLEVGNLCGKPQLLKFGVRPDDGIRYSISMFDNQNTVEEIGDYVSKTFDEGIKYTIANYRIGEKHD
jgi:nucleoside-diphosphate-sugar epimerase